MRVQVWSDVICPWCYLGKRRLVRAIKQWEAEGGEPVEVVYRPIQLVPDAPRHTLPLSEEERRSYGVHSADQVGGYIAEVAADSGDEFTWRPSWKPNTFDAHRLLAYALEEGGWRCQGRLKEGLLRAHFLRGEDVSRHAVLEAAAAEAGLSGAAQVLGSGRYIGRVRTWLTIGALSGVKVAPTFVAANHALPGAQPVAALISLLGSARDGDDTEGSPVRAYRLAEGLLAVNDPLGALHILEPALEEHGDESSLQLLAARSYFGSCQLGQAREVLEHLVDRNPTDDYARFLLGRTMERVNDRSEALRHFRVAMALSPSPEYAQAVARVTTRIGA
ncbi:DsbA family protein [Salinispora pacifica]|uniref:DsbA family protein n=1 Tax=Salinispora pacifica TaxID=351187 RepID=UPI00036E2D65|nr:DsbA family protein [Salinispora pacifica]